jgi:ABC-type multidrug transport system permease subunit
MCYSPEVSFGTWLIGIIASLYLYKNGKPFLFPLVVSQMQLVEGLRWINVINEKILAILAKIVLYSQPVAAFYEAKKFIYIIPYIIAQSITELLYGSRDLRFVVADDGHFSWKWIKNPVSIETLPYWIGLLAGGSFILPTNLSIILLGLFAYYYINHVKYNTHGSLWCVSVNILWIYYLFLK